MPTTINGIGTHYYGKRDSDSRMGVCQHCGAQAKLESYTTRLWFVIVFIPIIPLKRVRLLDYCPRCSRHWVADPEKYEQSKQLAVSSALEKYRDDPSVEAALIVHAQLMGYHMYPEAERFRVPALEEYPQSAELRSGFASHLDEMGRWTEATSLYESAYKIDPRRNEVRSSLAVRRTNEGQLDEAYELLDFLRQPGAGQQFNLGQLESLAGAYQKAGEHEKVLEICQHLQRELPAISEHHVFRKLVTKSERAVHPQTSMLPEKSFSVLALFDSKSNAYPGWVRMAALGSVAGLLLLLGLAGFNEYRRTHRTLHVVSAFAQPISVSIDGAPPVSVTLRSAFPLSEGRHHIELSGPVQKQEDIVLQTNYWSRWTDSPLWIFNVEKLALLSAATVKYSVVPQPPTRQWLNDSELNFVPHVDYAFEEPPATMQVKSNSQTITKIQVGLSTVPPTTIFVGLEDRQHQGVAQTFAEGHLTRNPNDASLLNVYCQTNSSEDELRVTEFLKTGLWRKPISVAWHRAYQHQKSVSANRAALADEYDKQLLQDPNDASLLYLRGRVGATREDQQKYFRLANEKNPQSGWPAMGLAYDAANRGDWPVAKSWCDKAAQSIRTDPSFRALWHVVGIGSGEANAMEADYRQQLLGHDYAEVMTAGFYLADVLASQQKSDKAKQVTREWVARLAGPNASPETLATFDLMADYVCGNAAAFLEKKDQLGPQHQPRFQFQFLLSTGEPDAAVKIADTDNLHGDWPARLAISLAYSLAGKSTEANDWMGRACELLQAGDEDWKRAATLLERDTPPTSRELDDIVLRVTDTPLFLAALAQRFPNQSQDLLPRLKLLNVSRQPPYLLVQRVLERP